jgi:putative tryptophan/tyrosine transport system substrate-binding protein
MERRTFLGVLAGGLLAAPLAAEAQLAGKVYRIGLLVAASPGGPTEAFLEGLRALGYVEGVVAVEAKFAHGRTDQLPALARELLATKPEVIVTIGTIATEAAKAATTTIPIVIALAGDPVEAQLVKSLAKPGGNVTGLSLATPELAGKRLELLKEILPKLTRLAVLGPLSQPVRRLEVRRTQEAARALGVTTSLVEFSRGEELDRALAELPRHRPDALLVLSGALTSTHRARIIAFASKHRLPIASSTREWVMGGALMNYAPSSTDSCRRAATYVDKILKGAKPADLPVEQPTKFELVINLKTARALGLTIPQSLLQRADQVIE